MENMAKEVIQNLEQNDTFNQLDATTKQVIIDEVARVSEIDILTGAVNRVKTLSAIETEWARSKRYHSPVSLIVIDIDDFGSINSEYGHEIGDEVLRSIYEIIKDNTRKVDLIGRYGADEFMIIVPTTNNKQAETLAIKLLEIINSKVFMKAGKITCSFGIADREASMNVQDWLRIVEAAMKSAKQLGGNRIVDYETIAHMDHE